MNLPEQNEKVNVISWIWATTVKCPNPACKCNAPLIKSLVLTSKKGKEKYLHPHIKGESIEFSIESGKCSNDTGTIGRKGGTCLKCGTAIELNYIRQQGMEHRLGSQLIAVVGEGKRSRVYIKPDDEQINAANVIRRDDYPDLDIAYYPGCTNCRIYGMEKFGDIYTDRRRLSERKISFEKLDSEESIRKWNRGELPVALIHPASAGHGLNLQSGGNILIWFGLTWSLELYQQTVARLWRQGQSAETVVVQHIITAGTIDEDVMKVLANKDMTQNRLIAAVKARVTHGR